jgi:hypothetical protein
MIQDQQQTVQVQQEDIIYTSNRDIQPKTSSDRARTKKRSNRGSIDASNTVSDIWFRPNRTTPGRRSYADTGDARTPPRRPDRPRGHAPEERPERHLPAGPDRHRLPVLSLRRRRSGPLPRGLVVGGRRAGEVPVQHPVNGGQLVRVVQRAPRVIDGAAISGPAYLVMPPRHLIELEVENATEE